MAKYIYKHKAMEVNEKNYYDFETTKSFTSIHTFTNWLKVGNLSLYHHCEAELMNELENKEEPNDAMLIGSYVDAYFDETIDDFKKEHPELFKKDGTLYQKYEICDKLIDKIEQDELLQRYMSGLKQQIFTGEFAGLWWKIKTDNIKLDKDGKYQAIVDFKTCKDIHDKVNGLNFIESWGYDFQLALYQKIIEINTGQKFSCYICAISKDTLETATIYLPQERLNECLKVIENSAESYKEFLTRKRDLERCEQCQYCKSTRVNDKVINMLDL